MIGQTGWNKWKWVAFFLAPSLIGLTIFLVLPILTSFTLAFQDWNLLSPPKW
ncbi:MAG: sugar ABC transporter permease, partial [Anaerolinea sp.]|nr:sugar ABC transporter permease [Anaerolinea sp.]